MSEIVPSFDDYRQAQTHKAFRAIGRYLLNSLIEAGKCLPFLMTNTEISVPNAISTHEINDFTRGCKTSEFDLEVAALIRETPTDL